MGWKDFANTSAEELINIRTYSPFELEAKIAIFMDEAQQYEICLKIGSIIDCFFNLYMFANEKKLSDDALVLLLKLQSKLIENCEENVGIHDNIKYFSDAFKGDETKEIPYFGNLESCKDIIDYILQTFFQHYELYDYVFHNSQTEEVVNREISIDMITMTHPYPPPLEEGMTDDWYNTYLHPKVEVDEEQPNEKHETSFESATIPSEAGDSNETVSDEIVESLLATINPDDMKRLIKETAEKKLNLVKMELETKIIEKETSLMKNVGKMQIT